MGKVVLALTEEHDLTTDAVEACIKEQGGHLIRLVLSDFPSRISLVARLQGGAWETLLALGETSFALEEIRSVWWRRSSPPKVDLSLPLSQQELIADESRMALGGLLRAQQVCWVNHPERNRTAGYKPYQLALARRVGLSIPASLLTTDPNAARQFYELHDGKIICKALGWGYLEETSETGEQQSSSVYTSQVLPEHLQELDRVRLMPHFFQADVPKALELRITIIGESVFAAEIHSQQASETRVDWRRAYHKLTYAQHQLPPPIREKLLEHMRMFGLKYGAVDMILTPDKEYIYLETNPCGQYIWLEEETQFPISQTLATFLLQGQRSER